MAFTQRPGASLYWKRDGRDDAPALVLLNSIGTGMDLWDALLPRLRAHFAVLRLDTRGHGASTADPGDYAMAMLADDVLAVADAAGIERFSIAGVSLGGMIGMEAALRAPARVERLLPICTSATMDAASWNDRIAKVRTEGMAAIADLAMGRFLSDAAEPAIYDAVRRQLLTMNAQGYAGCGAAIRDMDLADRIGGITCPTLIVTGARDTSTPFTGHGEHLLARIPGATHVALEAAHLAPLEAPDALAGAILSFLES
ncbi:MULTISPECIES: 3-oxoadipate enol-lactonase [Sphingobium]|uniref:3-oxoadipate enol-lactonase n=1 Tax=Sphingobium cupriresistens TaxID=1132417 RepID=A0A8G2DV38_9SPHN|nr:MULTISPECIES: 3-oxoadipate enol-lactonase [Sphingobium]RYM09491.1 3-oxoadipate enol-lactonase [Sphingobium cupriresistens]WCP14885.1 3-oxoadipate enol-lactonase 2 [Sphingobium sp. AntQ-1]